MLIRPFTSLDLHEVMRLQGCALPSAGWSAADYLALSQNNGLLLVAEESGGPYPVLAGFAASRVVADEAELLNIAVDPRRRREGIGRALLLESIRRVREAGASAYYLEVRASNETALALYNSAGFKLHAVRKQYYLRPVEDAYVLRVALDGPHHSSSE